MVLLLSELQRIPTSGARAVAAFTVGGLDLLAIPQLATDAPGTPAGMNGGDSNTELLLLRREHGRYRPHATLPAPGGEDAEFFTIGGRAFLAVASIRTGAGPYDYTTDSVIHEWTGDGFAPFQSIPGYAAKQWKHWSIGERHFLGLAQGVELPQRPGPNRASMIYEWDGAGFVEFQEIPSRWAYNWHPFALAGTTFVAHAEHLGPSVLYRWDGTRFEPHQELLDRAGRAFAHFRRDGADHLLAAGLQRPPILLRWQGTAFEPVAELDGLGARELRVVEHGGRLLVLRVNFILGTPHDPQPVLSSQVYEWRAGGLRLAAEFPTSGGTDVEIVADGGQLQFVVANSLAVDAAGTIGFAAETVLYTATCAEPADRRPPAAAS